MTVRFVIIPLLIAVWIIIAGRGYATYKCDPAGNQTEMNICAEEEFEKADAELNKVYDALLQKEKKDALFTRKLRESQRAWIRFRDAELEATFACEGSPFVCWGSMYPLSYNSYKAKMTKDRTERLRKYLTEEGPAF